MGFLSGKRGEKSSTRLMTVSSFFLAGTMPFLQLIATLNNIVIDLFPYFTAFLTFSATTQVGKSFIEEKYIKE
jgi:hypothetical protein